MTTPRLQILIPQTAIAQTIVRLAAEIRRDYRATPPLILGTLKGAFIFVADLVRALALPVDVTFIRLSSYGSGTVSSGTIEVLQDVCDDLQGREVLIVEDIVDSGRTSAFLQTYLATRAPASVRLCTLLDKPQRRVVPVSIDYCGFTIPDVFVVGYGLDWHEQYRSLPDLCTLQP
ncbi:MAG: hypoxanthine phosphoribosyltransferase [Candidatus Tectimicrobiota bacterium]